MCLLTVGFLSNTVAMNSEIANGLDKIKNIESKWFDRIVLCRLCLSLEVSDFFGVFFKNNSIVSNIGR